MTVCHLPKDEWCTIVYQVERTCHALYNIDAAADGIQVALFGFSGLLFAFLVAFCAKWIDLWAWAGEPEPLLHTLPYYLAITRSSCEVSPFHLYALLFVNLVVTCELTFEVDAWGFNDWGPTSHFKQKFEEEIFQGHFGQVVPACLKQANTYKLSQKTQNQHRDFQILK